MRRNADDAKRGSEGQREGKTVRERERVIRRETADGRYKERRNADNATAHRLYTSSNYTVRLINVSGAASARPDGRKASGKEGLSHGPRQLGTEWTA